MNFVNPEFRILRDSSLSPVKWLVYAELNSAYAISSKSH